MEFHRDVKAKIDFFISHADIIQLLGALAVDFMSKDTEYKISLFSKMHIGRKDISKEDCHAGGIIGSMKGTNADVSREFRPNTDMVGASEHEMCKIIPEFHAKNKRQHNDEASITASLNACWNEEIQGKTKYNYSGMEGKFFFDYKQRCLGQNRFDPPRRVKFFHMLFPLRIFSYAIYGID